MSWILGYIGNNQSKAAEKLKFIHSKSLITFQNEYFYLAAGGNKHTVFYSNVNKPKQNDISGWILSGLGIVENNGKYKILTHSDWSSIFSKEINFQNVLDGHYVGIKWTDKEFFFFCDRLGLRDINIIESDNGFYFSTRIDWLAKLPGCKLNLRIYGSKWLLLNQISHESLLKNSIRIVAGSTAKIRNNKLTVTKHIQNLKRNERLNLLDFYKKIEDISLAGINSNQNISLSLSGGLDSRFLFAILLKKRLTNFETHTFGNPRHPDSVIARKLCKDFNIKHSQYEIKNIKSMDIVESIQNYVTYSKFTNPISSVLHLENYKNINLQNKILIDGGFGEIWRRGFMNKFLFKGKRYLLEKNYKKIASLLTISNSSIFTQEFTKILHQQIQEQISDVIDEMPDINDICLENWLDLFSIKTRLVNFYGPEQAYADSVVETYMPFAQQSVLNLLSSISPKQRKNNKLIKHYIQTNNSQLTGYPLAKGNVKVHFSANTIEVRLLSKIKTKLNLEFYEQEKVNFITNLREFIFDRINSIEFRENDIYNQNVIKENISIFFSGNKENVNFIDRWLAFDIFLNKFNNKSLY